MKDIKIIKYLLIILTLFIFFSVNIVEADTLQYRMVEAYTPENVFLYNETTMTIVVIDPSTGEPLLNMENNVTCYIRKPGGGFLINGTNPAEIYNGVYRLKFTVPGNIGTYTYWAVFDYNEIEYYGSGIFEARWDPYTNITEATYKIGDAVRLINLEDRNQTSQTIGHVRETTVNLEDIGVKTERNWLLVLLEDAILSEVIQIILMIIILLIVISVMNWIYGRKKNKNLAKDVSKVPGLVARLLKHEQ
jgi:hypothetical protein